MRKKWLSELLFASTHLSQEKDAKTQKHFWFLNWRLLFLWTTLELHFLLKFSTRRTNVPSLPGNAIISRNWFNIDSDGQRKIICFPCSGKLNLVRACHVTIRRIIINLMSFSISVYTRTQIILVQILMFAKKIKKIEAHVHVFAVE